MKRLIIGISGASGAIIGYRLVELLRDVEDAETHLVMSKAAIATLSLESNRTYEQIAELADCVYDDGNLGAAISSGSFKTTGMIVAPCSMKTLSGIANAYDTNLLTRAADVCLKEGRKVILMPREMPLNRAHLKNMTECLENGCVILPPMMTFYNHPGSIEDMVDHLIGKALSHFDIELPTFRAWAGV